MQRYLSLLAASLALFAIGCATYDAETFSRLAAQEQIALADEATVLSAENCDALRAGGDALLDENGTKKAFKGPFGTGAALGKSAQAQRKQGIICDEAVSRGLDDATMKGNFGRFWKAHDETFGVGGE